MARVTSIFSSYEWKVDEKNDNFISIRIYGINEKNENTCVIVNDFTPYVYIELPPIVDWDVGNAQLVASKIDDMMGDRKPIVKQLMFKKRLYYADLDEKGKRILYPYLFCNFAHTEDIRILHKKLFRPINISAVGVIKLKIHENNASPVLQLTSLRKIPTAGWIKFVGKVPTEKITHCKNEYIVKWKDLSPHENFSVASPYMMSFDLEVNSSVPSTMPKATRPADKIFQISCIFQRQGSKNPPEKYLLSLGEPDYKTLDDPTAKLSTFKTEEELLMGYVNLIQEKQPNVIMGYNIFGFDIPYMLERAKLLGCFYEFIKQTMIVDGDGKEISINWSSSAYKNQAFSLLDIEGRITVDLLPVIKRDHRLSNYKLDTVASHFLKGATKDPLDAQGIFKCYRLGMKNTEKGKKALGICGKYCIKDSDLVMKLFEKLNTWLSLSEMSKITHVPIFQLFTQGQQLKVFSQVYAKATHENTVIEKDVYVTKDDEHYMGATVFPPVPGLYKNVVPFDFQALYPTSIIANNICWSTLVRDEKVPDSMCHVMEWEEHLGCQHDPKVIRVKELTQQMSSLQEKVKKLRKERDASKKQDRPMYKEKIDKILKDLKPFRQEISDIKKTKKKYTACCKRRYRWLKSPIGVLPEILINLIEARKVAKKEMSQMKEKAKAEKDPVKQQELIMAVDVLDARQNALKISANSAYGILGTRAGAKLPLMPGAMCTTYVGRKSIKEVKRLIETEFMGKIVYGDTDSNYVAFPHIKNSAELWDYAVKVAEEISKRFPKPMKLAFEEKLYIEFCILTMKRYMSVEGDRDGKLKQEISTKGVLLTRRDNCEFVRNAYKNVMKMVFQRNTLDEILYYILQEMNNLCSGVYPVEHFAITKAVGNTGDFVPVLTKDPDEKMRYRCGDYVVKILPEDEDERKKCLENKECADEKEYYLRCMPAQVQLAEKMRKRGQLVQIGSRLSYVVTTNGGHTAKQFIKIESTEYFSRHSSSLKIDYLYYLHSMIKPFDQVITAIFGTDPNTPKDFVMNQYKFRSKIREKMLCDLRALFSPKIKFL